MESNIDNQIDQDVYKEILDRLNTYSKRVDRLSNFIIWGGILSIVCSLFVSAFVGSLGKNETMIIRIVSFAAAIITILMAAFNLTKKLGDIRSAWMLLNNANYRFKNKKLDTDGLLKAYNEAENLVGPVSFNYERPETR